jgi:two-component system sensor histidine kinase BaeS
MDAADRVAGGDYTARVAERGPRAVRGLGRSFNTMAERLQSHDRIRRDLMADVAHELRTPLTVIQGRLEGLMDGVYPRTDSQLGEVLADTFRLEAAADQPVVSIDPVRVREVLGNLVSNALQHTPSGGSVTIHISAGDGAVTIDVSDTGDGMSPEELGRAFERFYKGAGSHGSGLGLTIARSLVRAHGGDITAASQPGQGTRMTVRLPKV